MSQSAPDTAIAAGNAPGGQSAPKFGPGELLALLRRNVALIVAGGLLGLAGGAYYLARTPPSFTATSVLLVDNRKVRAVEDAYTYSNNIGDSVDSDLASQIELLKSDKIASWIVDKLQLDRQFESLEPSPAGSESWFSKLLAALKQDVSAAAAPGATTDTSVARQKAIERLRQNLNVRRVQRAQVLEISYTAPDGRSAAKIANAFSDAYISDQMDAQKNARELAAGWILEQLTELKDLVQQSENAVQGYKASHGIASLEGSSGPDARQLLEAANQLAVMRAEAAKAEFRVAKLQSIIDSKEVDSTLTDAISDPIVAQLRSRYVTTLRSERFLSGRVSSTHKVAMRLREEKQGYERLMFDELERMASTYRNELEITKSREKAMEDELRKLNEASVSKSIAQIELRELERTNEAYKKLYAGLLERNQAALQQQSFANRNARVITAAKAPEHRNGPSSSVYLGLSLAAGAMFGGAFGTLRELTKSRKA